MDEAMRRRILRVLEWAEAYIGAGMSRGVYDGCVVDPQRALDNIGEVRKELQTMNTNSYQTRTE